MRKVCLASVAGLQAKATAGLACFPHLSQGCRAVSCLRLRSTQSGSGHVRSGLVWVREQGCLREA